MLALQMTDSIPRYLMTKGTSRARRHVYWSRGACFRAADVPAPVFPNENWVRIRTRYGGICGSDIGTITLKTSTTTTVVTSFPFTLGHENVGTISELGHDVDGFDIGQRVVVNPLLSCEPRGFDDLCPMCAAGDPQRCVRMDQGDVSPGILIGFCRDTGGSWSQEFIAHKSQLIPVPEHLSDRSALMTEPFAVAVHPVIRDLPGSNDAVLVIGGGVIGLCTIAAIRALGSTARIIAIARHPFQAEAARTFGADVVIGREKSADLERRLVDELGARALKPVLGANVIIGGADYVYDCAGTSSSLKDSLRFAGPGGTVVLLGLASLPKGIDWTPVWMNELRIQGTICYGISEYGGQRASAMNIAVRLMAEGRAELDSLVTHTFAPENYAQALTTVTGKGSSGVIKAAFEFEK